MSIFRVKIAGVHLLASFCALGLLIGLLYFFWYRWPGWYLLGAHSVVGILVLVDVLIGPLATLVVGNPSKPRRELRRDIALIVSIQMLALGYGAYTLWIGRPLYYAFSVDRIQIVPAAVFDEQTLARARQLKAAIMPGWTSLPQWIWVPLPDDPAEAMSIIAKSVLGGPDIVYLPQYYRSYAESIHALRRQLLPMSALLDSQALSEKEFRALLAELDKPESEMGVLPVEGRANDGAWIMDRNSGKPLSFQRAVIWEAARRYREQNKEALASEPRR